MPILSKSSLDKLSDCHIDLQYISRVAIKIYDFIVSDSFRDKTAQDKAVAAGLSKTPYPTSKHNKFPSEAEDIHPYPFNANPTPQNINRYYFQAGVMFAVAYMLKERGEITHDIRWGGDFNMNMDFTDDKWKDLPHFELKEK